MTSSERAEPCSADRAGRTGSVPVAGELLDVVVDLDVGLEISPLRGSET